MREGRAWEDTAGDNRTGQFRLESIVIMNKAAPNKCSSTSHGLGRAPFIVLENTLDYFYTSPYLLPK